MQQMKCFRGKSTKTKCRHIMYHSKGSMNEGIPEAGLYYFPSHRPAPFYL